MKIFVRRLLPLDRYFEAFVVDRVLVCNPGKKKVVST